MQMQTVFRNPLAGPSVLGISSGASLGVPRYDGSHQTFPDLNLKGLASRGIKSVYPSQMDCVNPILGPSNSSLGSPSR